MIIRCSTSIHWLMRPWESNLQASSSQAGLHMINTSIVILWTWRLYQFLCMRADSSTKVKYHQRTRVNTSELIMGSLPFPWKQWLHSPSCGDASMFYPYLVVSLVSQGHVRKDGMDERKRKNSQVWSWHTLWVIQQEKLSGQREYILTMCTASAGGLCLGFLFKARSPCCGPVYR